jgi:hypothetical protein
MMSTKSNLQDASKWKVDPNPELIPPEQGGLLGRSDRSIRKVSSILTLIKKLLIDAIAVITTEPELRIWQKQDRNGHIHWYVYDPLTSKSISFASELEMLSWLEDFHSRSRW